jgi:hypothetical protein
MSMDHAAAHEELADLALEPRRLERLEVDEGLDASALRAHVSACADCAAELDAWMRVYRALEVTTSESPGGRLRSVERTEPAGISPALRDRTLAAIRSAAPPPRLMGVPADAAQVRRGPRPEWGRFGRVGWLAAAAALVIAVGAGGLAFERARETDQARGETTELAAATTSLYRILATPTHWVVTLRTADGAAGGTLAWSGSEVVVLTAAISGPSAGTTYRCWIERGGKRTPVGAMSFAGGIGYWTGSTQSWGGAPIKGDRFGVTAVPDSGMGGGPAVLVAEL